MAIDNLPAHLTSGEYEYKKAARADFMQVRRWLDAKHLADWWTPSEGELLALEKDEKGYAGYIVSHQGLAFAYIQMTSPGVDSLLAEQGFASGTLRVDQFVGDAQMIGFGHGIKFIKAFVGAMKSEPAIVKLLAVPAKENVFAQRSFTQSGFRSEKTLTSSQGSFVLMTQPVA